MQLIERLISANEKDIEAEMSKQRWWQNIFNDAIEVRFRNVACLRLHVLQKLSAAHSAVDVTSLVSGQEEPTSVSSRAWTLLARYRVGLPLDSLETRLCPGCAARMDALGDHALCCHPLGIYNRHNELRNEFALLCKELGLQVDLEKGPEGSILRPADALVQGLDNSPIAVDFSVVHTLQTSDMRPGKLVKQAENRTSERSAICRQEGWNFVPFIVETVGMWGGKARYLSQKLMRLWALKNSCSMSDAALSCRARLALAVVRGLARQLERGFPARVSDHAVEDFEDVLSFCE